MIKLVKLCLISCRTMHSIMGNNRNESMRSEASGIIKQMIGETSLIQDELDELLGSTCKLIKKVYLENQYRALTA